MNEDITKYILEFREAMRHLWNNHARHLDGDHRFSQIERDYFYYSVLFQAENRIPETCHITEHYYQHISVIPTYKGYLGNFLLGKKISENEHKFEFISLTEESNLDLRFISFFDFTNDGLKEYKYAKTHVLNAKQKTLVGSVILIDSEYAKYRSI